MNPTQSWVTHVWQTDAKLDVPDKQRVKKKIDVKAIINGASIFSFFSSSVCSSVSSSLTQSPKEGGEDRTAFRMGSLYLTTVTPSIFLLVRRCRCRQSFLFFLCSRCPFPSFVHHKPSLSCNYSINSSTVIDYNERVEWDSRGKQVSQLTDKPTWLQQKPKVRPTVQSFLWLEK